MNGIDPDRSLFTPNPVATEIGFVQSTLRGGMNPDSEHE